MPLAGDKRGSHLTLSLERLDQLAGRCLQRIGLSATQKPIQEIGRLLVGHESGRPGRSKRKDLTQGARHRLAVIDAGHRRDMELAIEVPEQELGPITTHELWEEIYDRIAAHAASHRSTLVFVNTRRLAERVAHRLTLRLGEGRVAAHHGSLSRQIRLEAERGLKSGGIPVVVATASLELGIDIGHVDLVCHIGAPRALANLLQRVGRSGHAPGGVLPKGILLPLTRDELLQCAAAVRAARAGELDQVIIPQKPLDILAQQMVAAVASREMAEEELYQLVTRAYPFRSLTREEYEDVLVMLSEGIATRRGRRSALIHRDRVNGRLRARRGARLAAITSGGAIPDTADFDVVEEPAGVFVGRVNEDFATESQGGDVFLLGNKSWRTRRVEAGRLRTRALDTAYPSPMSHEILNANPYAFLDDAPLEERRARAVSLRRIDPDLAGGLGALDAGAIEEVRSQAWPEVRDPDELHDVLLSLGLLPEEDARGWGGFLDRLVTDGRAALARWGQGPGAYLAAERLRWLRPLLPDLRPEPSLKAPAPTRGEPQEPTEEDALRLVAGGWMEALGPTTASGLASRLGLSPAAVERGLALLEGGGTVLQGRFTPGRSQGAEPEWCDRRLLSRIHRLTLNRLRREIEAVSAADFLRFLFRWQHLAPGTQLHGPEGVLQIFRQLLRRYGVVFRELLARETRVPPWRELLRAYRPMEARGEVRGGRFVAGFVGEQFALPEAVEVLRAVRRRREPEAPLLVRAADPLNLVGILTPGGRVSPLSRQVITYRQGVPVDVGELGAVRHRLLNVSG